MTLFSCEPFHRSCALQRCHPERARPALRPRSEQTLARESKGPYFLMVPRSAQDFGSGLGRPLDASSSRRMTPFSRPAGFEGNEVAKSNVPGVEQNPATPLCKDTLTLPFAKLTAGSKQAHACHVGQVFIREINFDALTSGATYLVRTFN